MGQLRSLFFWRAILAEFLGTTIYVAVTLGVTLTWDGYKVDDHLRVALCFGLALAVVSYMFMPTSGGHLNPAVTISCAIARRIPVLRAVAYLLVQCGGGMFHPLYHCCDTVPLLLHAVVLLLCYHL